MLEREIIIKEQTNREEQTKQTNREERSTLDTVGESGQQCLSINTPVALKYFVLLRSVYFNSGIHVSVRFRMSVRLSVGVFNTRERESLRENGCT
jgi:hypothetical protein